MALNTLDISLIIGYTILALAMFISLFFEFTDTLQSVGDWTVMLTHLVIIPAILVEFKRSWYMIILLYSLVTSVFYHISKLGYIGMLHSLGMWDVAGQNVLMSTTFALLVYDPTPIPEWVFLLIGGVGLFIASLGEIDVVGDVEVYELIGGMILIAMIIYLVYRILKPSPLRDTTYMVIAAVSSIVASITFYVAGNIEARKYSMCHSIWHVSAYIMLYFILKAIKTRYEPVKRQSRFPAGF